MASVKRIIAILLVLCLSAVVPAAAEEIDDADLTVVALCDSDSVQVGDQFMVRVMLDGEFGKYLTYSVAGSFDCENAELIAPVYKDDGFSIVWNKFSNDDGTFQFDAADIAHIQGSGDPHICSLLFKAKKAGKFTLNLGEAGGARLFIGRAGSNGGKLDYDFKVQNLEIEINEPGDGHSPVIIIAEREKKTPYDDMEDYEWAEIAVGALARLEILKGIADGTEFEPAKSVTRGEFAAMLVRGAKLKGDGGSFPDVPENHPFASEIRTAKKLGIALGDENGNFNPDSTVTRQEISAFVFRALNYLHKLQPADETYLEPFPDKDEISDYAVQTMAGVVRAKLLKGDDMGRLNPKQNMTRAEAAVLIESVIVHIKLVR